MKIVAAFDSFKGSLSAKEVGVAFLRGVRAVGEGWQLVNVPMADGGEGTLDVLAAAGLGEFRAFEVPGALGRPRPVRVLWDAQASRAFVESAEVVGLDQVEPVGEHVFGATSSFGLGVLLGELEDSGAREVFMTLGGSGTTDGGLGLLLGLGAHVIDAEGETVRFRPGENPLLAGPEFVSVPHYGPKLVALTDVDNPYTGARGAAAVFGPQKGMTALQVAKADELMERLGAALEDHTAREIIGAVGAGAAGGLGGAILALGATVQPGINAIADLVGLEEQIEGADLVVTGEGKMDAQTLGGKTPFGVATLASRFNVPTVALAGTVEFESSNPAGLEGPFAAVLSIQSRPRDLAEALQGDVAAAEMERMGAQVARLLLLSGACA